MFGLAFAVAGQSAQGQAQTTQGGLILTSLKLQEYCALVAKDSLTSTEEVHESMCLFYISGVADGYNIGSIKDYKVCLPKGVTLGEMALVVNKYFNEHPDYLHNPPEYLIIQALYDAFPCRTKSPNK